MKTYDNHDMTLFSGQVVAIPAQEADLVEKWEAPKYTYAGFTIAQENAMECTRCFCIVKESGTFGHNHWHEVLERPRHVV